ncbi:hypothetical protein [Conyzicola sp.]|uniref:hypothetical protein n=1 Tax=Conyzicola sp. TaxID=1969404 RepID=UPI00398A1800
MATSAPVAGDDGLAWLLASGCALAFILAAGGAVLLSAHQRRQRVPHPHYHRHSPTDVADSPDDH